MEQTKELSVNPEVKELLVGLSEDKASQLKEVFMPMLDEVQTFEDTFNEIVGMEITTESCKKAKRLRLDISKIRTGAAKAKKFQKAELLRHGKAIDGFFHIVEYAVASKEEKLKEIETYHERIEAERKAKLETERIEALLKYECDGSTLSLGEMSDVVWENFLAGTKNNYQAVQDAARKAEEDRIEAERIANLEKDRRYQCSRLVDYIPEFETMRFSSLTEEEYLSMVEEAKEKRAAFEAEQEEIRLENEKLKKEAIRKEAVSKKEEAERKARKEAKEKKEDYRMNKMVSLDLKFNGQSFIYKDINFHWTDLLCLTDKEFETAVSGATKRKAALDAEEKKAEEARLAEEEKQVNYDQRLKALLVYGDYFDRSKLSIDSSESDFEQILMDAKTGRTANLKKQNEALEKERKEKKRIQKKLDDEKALREKHRLEEEKRVRDAKAAPDKEKLRAILINFDSLRGNLSTKEAQEAVQKAYNIIENAVKAMEE